MAGMIISPSKIVNALWQALELTLDPNIKPFGEALADPKSFGNKNNRLFFEIEGDVNALLIRQEQDAQFFNFKGQGSIIYYQNSFNEKDDASLKFSDLGELVTSSKGHSVAVEISPNFSFSPSEILEFRGYVVRFPMNFNIEIKEEPSDVGTLKDFGFTLENKEKA